MSTIQGNLYYHRTGTLYTFLPWTKISLHLISSLQKTQPIVLLMLFPFNRSYSCCNSSFYICQTGLSVIHDSKIFAEAQEITSHKNRDSLCVTETLPINTLLRSLLGRLLIGILLRKCYTTLFGLQVPPTSTNWPLMGLQIFVGLWRHVCAVRDLKGNEK